VKGLTYSAEGKPHTLTLIIMLLKNPESAAKLFNVKYKEKMFNVMN
jgi:hypothetical protein